ncbi:DUF4197 domain-containing protein [Tunicatimonas pelagia]|uniref:DUF4197 domain-containing protein n=1 Tax=Tunicatimonas pelagia TaxID=931531 RepID=UPI0026652624|nr:DUF4197 domain-containing protein [Tunicatimonas pelagia]WKN42463.1 DUF4197 domain-containing protein [Tunicatimonas pelagia]
MRIQIQTTLLMLGLIATMACDTVNQVLKDMSTGGLTTSQITAGLKEALKTGARFAGKNASQKSGYLNNPIVDIRILMPPELRKVERNIRRIPLVGDRVVDDFVEAMNRGAEQAAKEAAPIFVKAITSMTINDAANILRGDSTAATNYLKRTTTANLEQAFRPVIKKALDQVKATRYYDGLKDAIGTYNRTPLANDINVNVRELPELEDYATDKALEGLFTLVSIEEKKIRRDPYSYSQSIIRQVFGSQKSGL